MKPIHSIVLVSIVLAGFAAVSAIFPLKAQPTFQRTALSTSTAEIWPTGTGNAPTLTPSITQYVGPTFTDSGPLLASDPDSLIAMVMALPRTISSFRVYIYPQLYNDYMAWIILQDRDGTDYQVDLTILPNSQFAFESYQSVLRQTRTSLQQLTIGDRAFIAPRSWPVAAMYYRNAFITMRSNAYVGAGGPTPTILSNQQLITVLQTIYRQALQLKVTSNNPTITSSGPLVEHDLQMDKVPRTIGNFLTEPIELNEFVLTNTDYISMYNVRIRRLHSSEAAILVFQRVAETMTGRQSVNVGEGAFIGPNDNRFVAVMRYRNVVVTIAHVFPGATLPTAYPTPSTNTMTETLNAILSIIKNL